MAFSLKVKKEVLEQVNNGMSVSEASRKYNVARTTISNWLKAPENYLKEDRSENQPYDLEEKIDVIRLFDKGDLSVQQIAKIKNLKYQLCNVRCSKLILRHGAECAGPEQQG